MQNCIDSLSKLTMSFLLVNIKKKIKVAILAWKTWKTTEKVLRNWIASIVNEDGTQTQWEFADQLNITWEAISIRLKAMEKI